MDGKTKAIVAHITIVGWIIALIINSSQKDEIASYYIRQTLALHLAMLLGWIPFFGWFLWIAALILLILSIVGALNGEIKETPIVGKYFQDWFKGI